MARKLTSRYGSFSSGDEERPSPWQDVEPDYLADFVRAVTDAGDAAMLSRTSDGGAARVMLFSGDVKERFYAPDGAKLNELLKGIADHLRKLE